MTPYRDRLKKGHYTVKKQAAQPTTSGKKAKSK